MIDSIVLFGGIASSETSLRTVAKLFFWDRQN